MKKLLAALCAVVGFSTYSLATGTLIGGINPPGIVTITTASIPAGATNYIQNTSTLQSGATFFTSSGTATNFNSTSERITGSTITTLSVGTLNFTGSSGAAQTKFRYFQYVSSTSFAGTTTTGTSFLSAGATAQITIPASGSTHDVKICVAGTFRASNSVTTTVGATIMRNNVDIVTGASGGGLGLWYVSTSASVDTYVPLGGCYVDLAPGAGTFTYAVGIKANGAGGSAQYPAAGSYSSIVLEEISN